jgi:hypothetical protein
MVIALTTLAALTVGAADFARRYSPLRLLTSPRRFHTRRHSATS